jgi:hypothetical protein
MARALALLLVAAGIAVSCSGPQGPISDERNRASDEFERAAIRGVFTTVAEGDDLLTGFIEEGADTPLTQQGLDNEAADRPNYVARWCGDDPVRVISLAAQVNELGQNDTLKWTNISHNEVRVEFRRSELATYGGEGSDEMPNATEPTLKLVGETDPQGCVIWTLTG